MSIDSFSFSKFDNLSQNLESPQSKVRPTSLSEIIEKEKNSNEKIEREERARISTGNFHYLAFSFLFCHIIIHLFINLLNYLFDEFLLN